MKLKKGEIYKSDLIDVFYFIYSGTFLNEEDGYLATRWEFLNSDGDMVFIDEKGLKNLEKVTSKKEREKAINMIFKQVEEIRIDYEEKKAILDLTKKL